MKQECKLIRNKKKLKINVVPYDSLSIWVELFEENRKYLHSLYSFLYIVYKEISF